MTFFWIVLATKMPCWQQLVFSALFNFFDIRTSQLRLNHPNLFPDMGLHSCFVSHILCTKDPLFVLASPSDWIGVTEPRLSLLSRLSRPARNKAKKVKWDTDQPTNRPTDGRTKRGVESRACD